MWIPVKHSEWVFSPSSVLESDCRRALPSPMKAWCVPNDGEYLVGSELPPGIPSSMYTAAGPIRARAGGPHLEGN